MKLQRLIMVLLVAGVAASVAAVLFSAAPVWRWSALAVCVLLLALLYRGMLKPGEMVEHGLELLSAQDYNNRLAKVGQPDADKVADLFNRLMDRLREQRTRNREQDRLLRQLIEATPMGVAMMDYDMHITDVNAAFVSLLDIGKDKDVAGLTVNEIGGETADAVAKALAETPEGGNVEVRLGDTRVYRCYRLWYMESGFRRPFLLVESLTDELRRAERRAYEKIIRVMAHEVNNSLGGMESLLDMLATVHADDADMAEVIESCRERCVGMGEFISSYADVVRLPEPALRRYDPVAEVNRQRTFLESVAGAGTELVIETGQGVPSVMADAAQMGQVLVNIVKNAGESIARRGGGGGRICIGVRRYGKGAEIEITDNGTGLPHDIADDIYQPYFTTRSEGQGIGLMLVWEILRRHGCTFSLRTHDDGLTHFVIRFRQ